MASDRQLAASRESKQRRIARLRLAGLCIGCGTASVAGATSPRCEACRAKCSEASKKCQKGTFARRKAAGLCFRCGVVPVAGTGHVRCDGCRVIDRAHQQQWRDNNPDRCIQCWSKNAAPGRRRCVACQRGQRRRDNARILQRAEVFLCIKCPAPCLPSLHTSPPTTRVCETCYFKRTASQTMGDRRRWSALRDKLVAQCWRCAYTGEAIVLGVNDALDHADPVSRFPERRADLSNVEWVTRDVNQMKWNRTRAEFLDIFQRVAVAMARQSGTAGEHPRPSVTL